MVVLDRVFDPSWEVDLLGQVDLLPSDRVLDVSSLIARPLAPRFAERWWSEGAMLPFGDGSFDVVVYRQGPQLLPAPGWTLSEMRRVLAPGGRAAVSVWGQVERMPVLAALTDVLEKRGRAGASMVRAVCSLSDPADLRAFLAGAGFERIGVRTVRTTVVLPSVGAFVRQWVPDLADEDQASVAADLEMRCARRVGARGLRMAIEAHIAVGSV